MVYFLKKCLTFTGNHFSLYGHMQDRIKKYVCISIGIRFRRKVFFQQIILPNVKLITKYVSYFTL